MAKKFAIDQRPRIHGNAFAFSVPGAALLEKGIPKSSKNNEDFVTTSKRYTDPVITIAKCAFPPVFDRSASCVECSTTLRSARREAGQFEVYI